MSDPDLSRTGTKGGLSVAPALEASLVSARVPVRGPLIDSRVVVVSFWSMAIGLAAGFVSQALLKLIALITNLSFYHRISFAFRSPAENTLGLSVIAVPIVGAIVVGLMARFGSKAIRGHGIPEAMEQVLLNKSRIAPRLMFLKPLSAAVSIGTGGPFGAEGPIISTGGAIGSVIGQLLKTTPTERKILLAAGAAAGMSATFGCPVSAVLLAVELLLFEFRGRSLVPVALASAAAMGVRLALVGAAPAFAMTTPQRPGGEALLLYTLLGAAIGVAAVGATKAVYAIEDVFERLPVHWMWWPAIGAVAVGLVGYFNPRTLGVGYDNIDALVSARFALRALVLLALLKFVSWSISLGSGTSGGTMAPLFTIGGALGAIAGAGLAALFPGAGIDVRISALVGMAAMFAGASRALLTSVVLAFETTLQPLGLLPLLSGCTASFLVASLLMRESIMTEKISRRGVRVPTDYEADFLSQVLVREVCSSPVVTLSGDQTIREVREWMTRGEPGSAHQGFPVVVANGDLRGVITRRTLLEPSVDLDRNLSQLLARSPAIAFADSSVREAADLMVREDVGRLPVVERAEPSRVTGFITRGDVLAAHRGRLDNAHKAEREIAWSRGVRAKP